MGRKVAPFPSSQRISNELQFLKSVGDAANRKTNELTSAAFAAPLALFGREGCGEWGKVEEHSSM